LARNDVDATDPNDALLHVLSRVDRGIRDPSHRDSAGRKVVIERIITACSAADGTTSE
jgi:hypothetical protein